MQLWPIYAATVHFKTIIFIDANAKVNIKGNSNLKHIIQNGGCGLILRAMKLHPTEVDLHIQAFHAMACLGSIGRETMDQTEFTQIIINSLEKHTNNVELVSAALHAVGALANSGITNY